jgi:hypothetical protein
MTSINQTRGLKEITILQKISNSVITEVMLAQQHMQYSTNALFNWPSPHHIHHDDVTNIGTKESARQCYKISLARTESPHTCPSTVNGYFLSIIIESCAMTYLSSSLQ